MSVYAVAVLYIPMIAALWRLNFTADVIGRHKLELIGKATLLLRHVHAGSIGPFCLVLHVTRAADYVEERLMTSGSLS